MRFTRARSGADELPPGRVRILIHRSISGISDLDLLEGKTVEVVRRGVDSDGNAYLVIPYAGGYIVAHEAQLEYEVVKDQPGSGAVALTFTDP